MAKKNNQFSINLPEGWTDTTIYTFQGPNKNGVQHNLVLVIDSNIDKDIDAEKYAKQNFENLKSNLPGFEMINQTSKKMSSGVDAYEIIYKYLATDEVKLYQKQIFMIIDQKAYSFTSSFSKNTLKTIAVEVDEIITSFIPASSKENED